MEKERSIDKLARYTMLIVAAVFTIAVCWYFSSVLIFVILAAVVSLLGHPIMRFLRKAKIKGKSLPDALLAVVTLIILVVVILGIVTQVFPVVFDIIQTVSNNLQNSSFGTFEFSNWLDKVNKWMTDSIPLLDKSFRIEDEAVKIIGQTFKFSSVTSVVGSVASAIGSFGIGMFAVIFISFFFIKDESLFRRIVGSLVPDKIEDEVHKSIGEIEHLLSRYFLGLFGEVLAVALFNFFGLWLIGGLHFYPAVGIAFMAGLLNIIPYVGPWIGGAIGVTLGVILKCSRGMAMGIFPNIGAVALTLAAIFIFTQLIDNFLLQPLIYSASIKSSPLEIFIVLLIAGHLGGMIGMLVAIPAYTVARVVASRFFRHIKPIGRLISATEDK